MKIKHNSSPMKQILIGLGIGCAVAVILCMSAAALISNEILPQQNDVIYSASTLAVATLVAIKTASIGKGVKKWVTALIVIGVYFALMLIGNLFLKEPDLELILLNTIILVGAGLVSLVAIPKKRKAYRVKY